MEFDSGNKSITLENIDMFWMRMTTVQSTSEEMRSVFDDRLGSAFVWGSTATSMEDGPQL
jgi:hypothetical protein